MLMQLCDEAHHLCSCYTPIKFCWCYCDDFVCYGCFMFCDVLQWRWQAAHDVLRPTGAPRRLLARSWSTHR